MVRQPHVSIRKAGGAQPWRVRLVGANGEIITASEGYFSKWNAKRAALKMFPSFPIHYD